MSDIITTATETINNSKIDRLLFGHRWLPELLYLSMGPVTCSSGIQLLMNCQLPITVYGWHKTKNIPVMLHTLKTKQNKSHKKKKRAPDQQACFIITQMLFKTKKNLNAYLWILHFDLQLYLGAHEGKVLSSTDVLTLQFTWCLPCLICFLPWYCCFWKGGWTAVATWRKHVLQRRQGSTLNSTHHVGPLHHKLPITMKCCIIYNII